MVRRLSLGGDRFANAGAEDAWGASRKIVKDNRTSLLVDPPDGRFPPLTPEAEKRLWLVALAGPLASAMLAAIFWPLSVLPGQSGLVFTSLSMLNLVFVVANLIPSPITDGGFIVQSIFGVRVSWRRFALIVSALWVISEVIAAYLLL